MKRLKVSFDEIDKKKYQAMVDEVVDAVKKGSSATATQAKKLSAYLKEDYKQMASK